MFYDDKKIDESFCERVTIFQNREELHQSYRVKPPELPATHTWGYRYEEPDLAKNRHAMPRLIEGPRELTLDEIREKSKDFDTLGLAELRWIVQRYSIQMLPLKKGEKSKDELVGIREAIRHYIAHRPKEEAKPAKQVRASSPAAPEGTVLPDDIAAMDDAALETLAAEIGVHEEYMKLADKAVAVRRDFLARKRGALQPA